MQRKIIQWSVFFLITTLLLIPKNSGQCLLAQQGKKEFTIEQIMGSGARMFSTKSLQGVHWMRDSKRFSYLEYDTSSKTTNIWMYDVKSRKQSMFLDAKKLVLKPAGEPFRIVNYMWSPDEKNILFTGTVPARSVKTGGNFFLYNLKSGTFKQLTDTKEPQLNVKFSPDGKSIGFVRSHNIFVMDLETGKETQLTFDGAEHVFNGHFDWVYEEEFGIIDGWQWSPDSKYIAFWRLDENRVPEFKMTDWDSLHLKFIEMRYPKAGDPNAIVKIGVVSLETKQTKWMDIGENDDIYISRIKWTNRPNTLSLQRVNRLQNKLELMLADVTTGKTKVILTEIDTTAWVEPERDDLTFLKNSEQFLWSSERSGFMHYYLYDYDGKLIQQLTTGNWEVQTLCGVDERNGTIYFTSTQKSPLERQLYGVHLDGSNVKRISQEDGTHSVTFSPDFEYYIDNFSSIDTPPQIRLHKSDGTMTAMLVENKMEILKDYKLGKPELLSFKTTDGVTLNASMLKPPDFDSTKKYPVLVETYGGPGSQVVRNSWGGAGSFWHQLLAQKGYIIFKVDNRGTGARGAAFKKMTYRHLGKWEVNDQIEGAKFLATQAYVDKTRIGIWGWSYGGYMASLTMFVGADYFKTGVAVAPVTHWKFYDTIYTERYMARPQDNPEGYEESAPITHAEKLKGNLLIIHGTADDNVHFQNTVELVNELQKHNKQFRVMFYPNRNHGIYGGNTRVHLYTMITNFILENL